ncbi:hypothetical protein PVAP13_7KG364701 [Panicum virgatum]|uniref:Uncharacterized protein n=1 Tax=Panicum virgatum TaxID=38727 RepID=A0A8T0QS16_PANVG|nr:hypothetical protein PVAP13_7KG364701 [Panicum virgatum]
MCSMRFLSGHFLNLLLEHLVSKMAIVIILSMLLNILIENTKICKKNQITSSIFFYQSDSSPTLLYSSSSTSKHRLGAKKAKFTVGVHAIRNQVLLLDTNTSTE